MNLQIAYLFSHTHYQLTNIYKENKIDVLIQDT
jgi:hypothetical protein